MTVNNYTEDQRIGKYCNQVYVEGMCSGTCSKCRCLDDESFKFDHNGKCKDCSCFYANEDRVDFRRNMYCYEDPEAELPGSSDTIGRTLICACGFFRSDSLSVPQMKVSIILLVSFEMEMPFFLIDSYFLQASLLLIVYLRSHLRSPGASLSQTIGTP